MELGLGMYFTGESALQSFDNGLLSLLWVIGNIRLKTFRQF